MSIADALRAVEDDEEGTGACWRGSDRGQPDGGGLIRRRRRRPSADFMRRAAPWLGLGTVQGAAPERGTLPPLDAADRDLLTPLVVVIVFTVFLIGFAQGADELFQDMGLEAYYADEDRYMTRTVMAPGLSREHLELSSQGSSLGRADVDEPGSAVTSSSSSPAQTSFDRRHQRRSSGPRRRRRDTLSTHAVRSIADRHKPKNVPKPLNKPDTPG
ncbi:uncharacterized protein [Dermacentor andersoni]|uniref:uncharacterized protein n=1 Tax=Dermacentor andersoni TaxID=34620 RepID=UPI0021557DFA|nr:uncharacterized protein LOC126531179 [Dermacentor andersoni]